MLEVEEEKLTASKSTFSFQRDFILEGKVVGDELAESCNESRDDWALSNPGSSDLWVLFKSHLAVLPVFL